jgi:cytoskeletal protein RodZ
LPTAEYSRLFLKSYAERLGLNINDIYALYDVHHRPAWEPLKARATVADTNQPIGPTPRLPAAKPIPTKFWIYLAVGLVAIALMIFGAIKLMKSADGSPER